MLRQSVKHTMNGVPEDGKKNKRKITKDLAYIILRIYKAWI